MLRRVAAHVPSDSLQAELPLSEARFGAGEGRAWRGGSALGATVSEASSRGGCQVATVPPLVGVSRERVLNVGEALDRQSLSLGAVDDDPVAAPSGVEPM